MSFSFLTLLALAVLFWLAAFHVVRHSAFVRGFLSTIIAGAIVIAWLLAASRAPSTSEARMAAEGAHRSAPGAADELTSEPLDMIAVGDEIVLDDAPAAAEEAPLVAPARLKAPVRSSVLRQDSATASRAARAVAVTPRPAWLDEPLGRQGNAYRQRFTIGPYTTREECEAAFESEAAKATARYVDQYLGQGASSDVRFATAYIHDRLVRDTWLEPVETSFGGMLQEHVLLEFDRQAQEDLMRLYRDTQVRTRLWHASLGMCGVLALVAGLHGYLRATRK